MIKIATAIIISALLGFFGAYLIFKKREKENTLYNLLNDFKKSIDEFKNQSENNAKEVKEAVRSASELTKILTTNQNLKGQFGEECLENILRSVYPNENIDWIKQFDTVNEDDKKIKPDYVVNLPDNKNILIDCKLNLEKYIEYKENREPELSAHKKNEFIKDINSTINALSNKKYQTANFDQPDFILMYIPLEPVITTIYTDKDMTGIIKNANEKNIIITGTSGILTLIRLTKLVWAKDTQTKNIENIINVAQNIYEAIAQHSQNLYLIKTSLEENFKNFNKEYEKITSNNKLFKETELLKEYGIQIAKKKSGKKLNDVIINSDFLK